MDIISNNLTRRKQGLTNFQHSLQYLPGLWPIISSMSSLKRSTPETQKNTPRDLCNMVTDTFEIITLQSCAAAAEYVFHGRISGAEILNQTLQIKSFVMWSKCKNFDHYTLVTISSSYRSLCIFLVPFCLQGISHCRAKYADWLPDIQQGHMYFCGGENERPQWPGLTVPVSYDEHWEKAHGSLRLDLSGLPRSGPTKRGNMLTPLPGATLVFGPLWISPHTESVDKRLNRKFRSNGFPRFPGCCNVLGLLVWLLRQP